MTQREMVKMMKIKDLKQDNNNANKGTEKGQRAIVKSIKNSGIGRSIVIDKNGKIIGGNKTTLAALEISGDDANVKVIESNGETLIVHKRNDLDLDDPDPNNPARQLAYADNITSYLSFNFDNEQFLKDIKNGFNILPLDIETPDLKDILDNAASDLLLENKNNDNYIRNVDSPTYEITGEKPTIDKLFSLDKTNILIKEIDKSSITDEEKIFLKYAAYRHIVFNFKNIAEYYAHANKEMQELMENNALVIIDFKKAIDLGFVELTKEIAEISGEQSVPNE